MRTESAFGGVGRSRVLFLALLYVTLVPTLLHAQTPTGVADDTSPLRVETYQSAEIDSKGGLRIKTADGRTIVVAKEGEQSSFGEATISRDRTAVGAQAYFPNCCTSYDIPLQLVVYARGKVHRFTGNGLPIFQWHFADRGTSVAFGQEPVHFGCSVHYELSDVDSERLIESADVPQPCGLIPNPPSVNIPPWVAALKAARGSAGIQERPN